MANHERKPKKPICIQDWSLYLVKKKPNCQHEDRDKKNFAPIKLTQSISYNLRERER